MTTTPFLKGSKLFLQNENVAVNKILACVSESGVCGWKTSESLGIGRNFGIVAKEGTDLIVNSIESNVGTIGGGPPGNATGENGVCIGENSQCADGSVTVGNGGTNSQVSVRSVSVLGNCQGEECIAIGFQSLSGDASPLASNSIAIGASATATGVNSITIGSYSQTNSTESICIGNGNTSAVSSIVLGTDVLLSSNIIDSVLLGNQCASSSVNSIVLGDTATVNFASPDSIACGTNSTIGNVSPNSVMIGSLSTNNSSDSVCIGNSITTLSTNPGSFWCTNNALNPDPDLSMSSKTGLCVVFNSTPNEIIKTNIPFNAINPISSGVFEMTGNDYSGLGSCLVNPSDRGTIRWSRIANVVKCSGTFSFTKTGTSDPDGFFYGTLLIPLGFTTGPGVTSIPNFTNDVQARGTAGVLTNAVPDRRSIGTGYVVSFVNLSPALPQVRIQVRWNIVYAGAAETRAMTSFSFQILNYP